MDTQQQASLMATVASEIYTLSLASSTLVQLGEVPNPETGVTAQNQALAHHSIGILEMLQEKTAGNLSPEEKQLLDGVLYEVRMKYVLKTQ